MTPCTEPCHAQLLWGCRRSKDTFTGQGAQCHHKSLPCTALPRSAIIDVPSWTRSVHWSRGSTVTRLTFASSSTRLPPRPGSGPPRQPATSWPGSQAAAGNAQPAAGQEASGHGGQGMSQEAGGSGSGRQAHQPAWNRGQSQQQQQQGGWPAGQPPWSQPPPQQQQQGARPERDVHARLQVLQQERDRLRAE